MILYIDPGTGSMLFSLAMGLLSVIWFGARKLYMKVKYLTPGKRDADSKFIPLVIFSDDKRYWKYFEPVCRELDERGFDVVYMTESEDDPAFHCAYPHVKAEFIGSGNRAYRKLNFLKAHLLLATTPGLDIYQWKRSKTVGCYVYLPHATNAMTTHKMFGLDFYDVLLTSGQYQIDLIRKLEQLRHEPEKELVLVGIPYMDELSDRIQKSSVPPSDETVILLAPSWGRSAALSRFGKDLIEKLLETGYHIIIRPHPQSFVSEKEMVDSLMREFPGSPQLEWNRDNDNFEVLSRADLLISDFSGTVFEFALAFDKPVLCVDTDFDDSQYDSCWLDETNWSIATLSKLGKILKAEDLSNLKEMIDDCLREESYKRSRHEVLRETWAHKGEGAVRAADYIERKLLEITNQGKEQADV